MHTAAHWRRLRRRVGRPTPREPSVYHVWQITLHWLTVALLAAIYMPALIGSAAAAGQYAVCTTTHVQLGLTVLLVTIWRLVLRLWLGVPRPEPDEPRLMRGAGRLAHSLLYVGLLLMTLSGVCAWYLGQAWAFTVHHWMDDLLLAMIAVHTVAALAHHFVLRSGVLMRMLFQPPPMP